MRPLAARRLSTRHLKGDHKMFAEGVDLWGQVQRWMGYGMTPVEVADFLLNPPHTPQGGVIVLITSRDDNPVGTTAWCYPPVIETSAGSWSPTPARFVRYLFTTEDAVEDVLERLDRGER